MKGVLSSLTARNVGCGVHPREAQVISGQVSGRYAQVLGIRCNLNNEIGHATPGSGAPSKTPSDVL